MMALTISEIRMIIDALEFKFADLYEEQAKLDDSHQNKVAELSNDICELELLIDRLKDDYTERVKDIENEYQDYFNELSKTETPVLVREGPETYTDLHKK